MEIKFSSHNSKLNKLAHSLGYTYNQVVSFDLPAGYTCPKASICKAIADKISGKITDSKGMQFRCYAASTEAYSSNCRAMRWSNLESIKGKSTKEIVSLISESLPKNVKIIRIHSSGDFFAKYYFMAWVEVARQHPDITFFGYTKVLEYVSFSKPENFHLVYSMGGKDDSMVTKDIPCCHVVNTIEEAQNKQLFVACYYNENNDYFCVTKGYSFALLVHGTQAAKTNK